MQAELQGVWPRNWWQDPRRQAGKHCRNCMHVVILPPFRPPSGVGRCAARGVAAMYLGQARQAPAHYVLCNGRVPQAPAHYVLYNGRVHQAPAHYVLSNGQACQAPAHYVLSNGQAHQAPAHYVLCNG